LSEVECQEVLDELHSERFVNTSPAQVWATLLDEGRYVASERTMYRILASQGESRERRNQLVHPPYAKPELLAEKPNELWSWDITKLLGPAKWTYYYLYVLLDVFSRSGSRPRWPRNSSPRPSLNRASSQGSSLSTLIVVLRCGPSPWPTSWLTSG
jgi:transposase InsO family protein